MIPQKVMGDDLRPVPVWAIGRIAIDGGGDTSEGRFRPVVYHKPVGQEWALKYVGDELPLGHKWVVFHGGFRRRSAAPGVIYASCRYKHDPDPNNIPNTDSDHFRVAAVSTDHGETWSYIPPGPDYGSEVAYNGQNEMGPICVTPSGTIIVATTFGGSHHPFLLYGTSSLDIADIANGLTVVGDFLTLAASESPTETEVLLCAARSGLWASVDNGASWFLQAQLAGSEAGTFARASKSEFLLSGGSAGGASTIDGLVWRTSDFETWEEFTVVEGMNFIPSVAARSRKEWVATRTLLGNPATQLQYARTTDAGQTWSTSNPVGMTRIRFLGDRYFGIRVGASGLRTSKNGVTWNVESLPAVPGGGTVILNDVFG